MRARVRARIIAVSSLAGLAVLLTASTASSAPTIHVAGADLVDGSGGLVQLRGVNRSGTEFACSANDGRGYSIFDGPSDGDSEILRQPQAVIDAMKTWKINVVRIPLNEHCWLADIGSWSPQYKGASYQQAVAGFVDLLGANGMYAILDLHVAGPDSFPNAAEEFLPMADAENSPSFWFQVAAAFKNRTNVLYDVYNEPHFSELGYSPSQMEAQWACWRDGCPNFDTDPNMFPPGSPDPPNYTTAGMQSLVNAIRATGSTQPIMLGGIDYSGNLGRWLAYRPSDSAGQLVASFHHYRGLSPSVLKSYDGTPTETFGRAVRAHFIERAALEASGTSDTTPPETIKGKGPTGRKAKFSFSSPDGAGFECQLDAKAFRNCTPPVSLKHLKRGRHKFRVRAYDSAGNVDPTPAVWKFRVR